MIMERKTTKEETERLISKAILQEHRRMQAHISSQIQNAINNVIPSLVDASVRSYMSGHILHVHLAQVQSSSIPEQQHQLYLAMKADPLLQQQDIAVFGSPIKFEKTQCKKGRRHQSMEAMYLRDSSSVTTSDEMRFQLSQVHIEINERYPLIIDEANRKEILVSPHPQKITSLIQRCQRDPEAPALSLINQDLLYLKKGNSGPKKIVMSLYKFPAIVFNDDDIEEHLPDGFNTCCKKKRQKEPGRPKEEIYSNSKIVQVIKTFWELGHEHKFITEIVARRANDCIVPDYADTGLLWSLSVFIRSSVIWERVHDFQLGIESYQQKINLIAPTITFPGIEECDVFSIVYEPVHGIIYTNSKKEKRVMRPSEIHKFCNATLRRTLEGLKSYYNDVKYGYVQKELTNDELEFLNLFEEE
ncbi:hypothetical protein Tco_0289389 [Tanacetum coccineum]